MDKKGNKIIVIITIVLLLSVTVVGIMTFMRQKKDNSEQNNNKKEDSSLLGFHYFLDENNKRVAITLNENYTCLYDVEKIPCTWNYETSDAIIVTTPYYSISEINSGGVLHSNYEWKTIEKCNEALKKFKERYSVDIECIEHFVTDRLRIEE